MSRGDLGVAAVVAAAGGLVWGVAKLAKLPCMAASSAPVLLGMRGWQLANVASFAVNVVSVSVGGRVDGEMAKEAKRAAKAKREGKSEAEAAAGVPRDSIYRSLFTPAGWAFAIWGVIYLGESVFVAAQASPSLASSSRELYAALAPWWTISCGLQALWCVAFRPWARRPRHFWISGALLATEAVALGRVARCFVGASPSRSLSTTEFLAARLPLGLHFGWITAAAVVNLNSLVAVAGAAPHAQLSIAFASVWGAAALGVAVALGTGDAVFAATLAWALAAVASDGGTRTREVMGETPLWALSHGAAWAARALAAASAVAVAIYWKIP